MRTAVLKSIFLVAPLGALATQPVRAEVRILASPGGQAARFSICSSGCAPQANTW